MRVCLLTTGTVLGLIVVAHAARAVAERGAPLRDPWWVLLTALVIGLSVWAVRLPTGTRSPRW